MYLVSLKQPVTCISSQGFGQTCLAEQVTPNLQMELLCSSDCWHTCSWEQTLGHADSRLQEHCPALTPL